jgi:hypothetical protein
MPDGETWVVDLCKKDSAPLENFRKKGIGQKFVPPKTGRRQGFQVTDLSELVPTPARKGR